MRLEVAPRHLSKTTGKLRNDRRLRVLPLCLPSLEHRFLEQPVPQGFH